MYCLYCASGSSHRESSPSVIVAHPDFRMFVLANRPGFPFLGNDFFGAMGMHVDTDVPYLVKVSMWMLCDLQHLINHLIILLQL